MEFRGTGGELFKELIVGAILTVITFGIYTPWFIVRLQKYVYQNVSIKRPGRSDISVEFTGSGGELFKVGLVGYLLSAITLGIYLPWFLASLNKYFLSNSRGRSSDGDYRLDSNIQGGEIFKEVLVGYLLTMVTFGIYGAWFMCKIQKIFLQKTQIIQGNQVIGTADFTGQGGELFVLMLVNYLLTIVTLGIYGAWMQVNLFKFFTGNTEVRVNGQTFRGEFSGTGGEYFVTMLVGYLLTMVTLGIYGFWFMAKLLKFQIEHTSYRAAGASIDAPVPRMAMPPRVAAGA
jgi:uncharacterized membrane protein YjgN (DUF898 family)